jgi:mRNA-degrading endonuclease RelE of RelBE toxin-antitoxin system
MKIVRSPRFDRAYRKLPPEIRKKFQEKVRLLVESNLTHPSLRIKKIQGTDRIFEASIDLKYRFTFEKIEAGLCLRVIGDHEVLGKP